MALGKAAASWRSWITSDTTLVKVQAFTANSGYPCEKTHNMFPVMVRVTALDEGGGSKPQRHVGIDIVAVLDISGSMFGDKLEQMKQAMTNVIDKLGNDDRLSIVSFESNVYRLMELTYMSEQGRRAAREKINELFTKGGTNMGPALHEGAQILRGRQTQEMSSRVGCIVFLSDGLDDGIFKETISPDFPAHTFGLGDDHDPHALKYIADQTSGTYSFVNKDPKKINYAFQLFIAGITSVAATSVEITLGTPDGVLISSIASGGYPNKTGADRRSGTVHINNMYAGDKKNFIVYLVLPATKEGKQKVLTIGGQYHGLSAVSKQLADIDVSVMRPLDKYSSKLSEDHDVAEELARVKRLNEIRSAYEAEELARINQLKANGSLSPQQQQAYLASLASRMKTLLDTFQNVPAFKEDYQKMVPADIRNTEQYKKSGLPYMLSWLSSNNWQRATTMDDLFNAHFLTPGQKDVQDASKAADASAAAAAANPPPSPSPTTRWGKVIARAKSNPCSYLLPSVAVALAVASLFLAMLYSAVEGSSKPAMNLGPLQYPMLADNNYAAWAIKMEAYMRAQGVWDAVVAKDHPKVSARKNQMALASIYQAIPEGTLFLLSQKKTAKSAWEALKTMHIGDQRLRDAKLQTLKLEFEGLRMKETESVDDFAVRLTTVVNKIHALGEHIEEPYTVKKFLRAVPNKYLQIASTIEQFGDLNTMTLQEVIGRLKVHEERLGRLGATEKENELLTRAEWIAREEADHLSRDASKVYASVAKILLRDVEKENELLTHAEWKAREVVDQLNHDASKVYASVAKVLLGRSGGGYGGDTYRVSASIAKILDTLLTSAARKEREVKSLIVEAHGDNEVTLRL
ncbi:uncharacterized protein [Aegilops tauschii subsp. strangulata]|uniref:VWFA domain-containing protein n=3 Tax=Aegilops tauschii subsp. strangulata TaxID=200361 RepID=A0A453JGN1_AEGTS|nr:uncharacterized protein LOC123493929 [Aegilops tauschii subsp. strangulata]